MIIDLSQMIERYELSPRTVLHVGAHHGQEDEIYRRLDIEPIYVEANPEVYAVLRKNVPDRQCHNVAIADRHGQVDFHVTSFDQSSSILELRKHSDIYPDIVAQRTISVPCTTIDRLLAARNWQIDLLNLDIQGAELLALQGASKTLSNVQAVLTEANRDELYAGCGLIGDLDRLLSRFDLWRVEANFKYHEDWGDAFYVRSQYSKQNRIWLSFRNWLETRRLRRSA